MGCETAFESRQVAQVVEPDPSLASETLAGFEVVLASLQVYQAVVIAQVAVEKNPLAPVVASGTVLLDLMLCFSALKGSGGR